MRVRDKYRIPKTYEETFRPMEKLPESAPGKSMQVDFGEYWMHRDDTRRVKVYFFAAVMSYSRQKFTYFSKTPFTSELAIYAHQLAFQFYGGKPQEVICDQDKVFIHSENFGDLVLTKAFQAFVTSEHFKCVFCRKSDPQSKGKVENVVKYIKYGFLRGRVLHQHRDAERICSPLACKNGKRSSSQYHKTHPRGSLRGRVAIPYSLYRYAYASPGWNEGIPCAKGQYNKRSQPLL
jgi:Transposase and inactivated derivatives